MHLRPIEIKYFAPDHTNGQWQIQDLKIWQKPDSRACDLKHGTLRILLGIT